MKLLLLIITFALSVSFINAEELKYSDIVVNIENFVSDDGNVRVHLYDITRKDLFPTKSKNVYQLIVAPIRGKKAQVIFKHVPYGKYAVTVHHDANMNVKMDKTMFGLPDEGWGVSNNIKHTMSAPNFDECFFGAYWATTTIKIKVNN